jgi:hypothetical protein
LQYFIQQLNSFIQTRGMVVRFENLHHERHLLLCTYPYPTSCHARSDLSSVAPAVAAVTPGFSSTSVLTLWLHIWVFQIAPKREVKRREIRRTRGPRNWSSAPRPSSWDSHVQLRTKSTISASASSMLRVRLLLLSCGKA